MLVACQPAYCAPEILNNMKYNEKVDIFSFGMMLHSMVTGGPPFSKSGPKGTPLAALQVSKSHRFSPTRSRVTPFYHIVFYAR